MFLAFLWTPACSTVEPAGVRSSPARSSCTKVALMKDAPDAILKPEQASYLEALEPPRDALLARMEARAAERRYPISDPEVASFLFITARASQPRFVVELGTNIGYGAIVMARAAGPDAR